MSKGIFATIEKTTEGLGGTTQALSLVKMLNENGIPAIYTREPAGTKFGEVISDATKYKLYGELCHQTELFSFLGARAQHVHEVIMPKLEDGYIVVCDRYKDSTDAHQGAGLGIPFKFLEQLHEFATNGLRPDITFILKGKPFRERNMDDNIESRDDNYYKRVEQHFLNIGENYSRCMLVDAEDYEENITNKMYDIIVEKFNLR